MGPIGVQEMIAIFLVALILFGPKKLPELGRTLGKALSEFRRAKNELKATFETHLSELEREARLSDSQSAKTTPSYSTAAYPHPYEEYGRSSYDSSLQATQADRGADRSAELEETAASQPSSTRPLGIETGNTAEQLSASDSAPVAGTVPRSNGIYSADAVTVSTGQESAP